MKRRSTLLLSLVVASVALASCKDSHENIGLFLYDETDTFVSSFSKTLIDKLEGDYNITTYDAKLSQSIQNSQIITELDNNKPEYLIVNMVDRLSSATIIQKANQTNTPVIFFNREPIYSDIEKYQQSAYYVGTDPNQEGINQGIMAAELMGDSKNINKKIDKNGDNKLQCVFIQGEPTHQDTEKRTYSCISYLLKQGYELDILAMETADWNKEKGYNVMSSLDNTYGDKIEFVFSNNDDMALGAIDYLLENNHTKDNKLPYPIVGVDGTSAGLESIKNGYLYGTTINDSHKQAEAIAMLIGVFKREISIEELKAKFTISETKSNYVYVTGTLVSQKTLKN